MSWASAYPHLKSRFTRILMRKGGFTRHDMEMVRYTLVDAGFDAQVGDSVLTSATLGLHIRVSDRYWAIETRRLRTLDAAVDDVFHQILTRYRDDKGRPAKARCSDCYACCNPPESWIVPPQQSRSCKLSQRLHPSKHRVPPKPVADPVYTYTTPRGTS